MEMLQGVWKQHLRPRAVVGYGVKIFLPSPPNYVTRSPGNSFCVPYVSDVLCWLQHFEESYSNSANLKADKIITRSFSIIFV